MDHVTGFLREGFRLVGDWLAATGDRGNLALAPEMLARSLYARLMSRVRQAELILRQLIWLLATTLQADTPAPPRPTAPKALIPGAYAWSFALMPVGRYSSAALDRFAERGACPPSPARMVLLMRRWRVLTAMAADPTQTARRMAARLAARKAAGLHRPVAFPLRNAHRLPGELGLTASFICRQANDALRACFDSS